MCAEAGNGRRARCRGAHATVRVAGHGAGYAPRYWNVITTHATTAVHVLPQQTTYTQGHGVVRTQRTISLQHVLDATNDAGKCKPSSAS